MHAGSGSRDLDAPLPGTPEMPGAMLIPADTYGDRAPFGSVGGGERTKGRSRRSTRAVYPASELSGEIILLLLHVCVDSVLARERWELPDRV